MEAASACDQARPAADAQARVNVYVPFFLAGILSVLTAGCLLGAVALIGISLNGSYTASTWTPYVLAHANSQLYGWVGFFVMGFALQHHAPRLSRQVLFHRLAYGSLILAALGVGLRFAAEPLAAVDPGVWVPIGVVSASMQFAAVVLFAINTAVTRHRSDPDPSAAPAVEGCSGRGQARETPTTTAMNRPLTWQTKFVFASMGWWLLVAAAEPLFFLLSHKSDRMASIQFVAEWFAPYREAQFLGFVATMIFGVALVRLNATLGVKAPLPGLGNLGFALWNVGLIFRMVGWISYYRAGMIPGSQRLYVLGGVLVACGAVAVTAASRLFEQRHSPERSIKFIRGAFVWLLIASMMMVLEPFHLAFTGAPFSHAFVGAMRHALTVGFISQMIVGMSLHVVPRLTGRELAAQRPLWSVFVLLNAGNGLRVVCEVLTDYTPAAFGPMAFTGVVELVALVLWAAEVGVPMLRTLRKPPVC